MVTVSPKAYPRKCWAVCIFEIKNLLDYIPASEKTNKTLTMDSNVTVDDSYNKL